MSDFAWNKRAPGHAHSVLSSVCSAKIAQSYSPAECSHLVLHLAFRNRMVLAGKIHANCCVADGTVEEACVLQNAMCRFDAILKHNRPACNTVMQ